ncbi:YciI family protein [Sabulilitoribacter multivorans]|uniref:YciI family protein n=2 Tax=Flaviramulus multivorans TaxID=1304750 RepID=A0ABS9IFB1_9FLAO|nr:YciI family protein [Flaviramulus multivorans]MCF7559466.1 YciI family protein [Flaviramulus multivorans]
MEMIRKLLVIIVIGITIMACKDETKASMNDIKDDIENTKPAVDSIIEVIETPITKSTKQIKEELTSKGFKTFDYIDDKTQDTILMQQYFIAFLKRGPIRGQNEEEAAELQKEHLAYLAKMYDLGYADISGPFGDDGDIRGITIYNVPTQKMADSLANADPMVKAGRLEIEIHPWWAAKGFPLR